MQAQARKSPHALFWIAGIAVTLFSAAGIAAIMGWLPSSASSPAERAAVVEQSAAPATPAATKSHQAPKRASAPVARTEPVASRCDECGVIESVREITMKGEGSGLGVVGGAVVGGVLGNQVGGGSGKKIATVVGAVGGAVAGNEVEKQVKTSKSYEIMIRLEDGSSRVINAATVPSWRPGDRVKIVNGVIQSNS